MVVKLDEVTLDVSLTAAFAGQRRRIAYERLILDLLAGLTLFRQSIKRIDVPDEQYRRVIQALIAHPPLTVAG